MEWRFDSRSRSTPSACATNSWTCSAPAGRVTFRAAELVYGELVGNAVRHAPGRIVVRLDWDDDTPVLTVHDEGRSFRPNIRLPDDPLSEHGRGLYIVRALALSLDVENIEGDGSQVLARLPVHKAA